MSDEQDGCEWLVPAYLGSPRQRAVKQLCVCVCVHACVRVCENLLIHLFSCFHERLETSFEIC